jgi:hypothetical protein
MVVHVAELPVQLRREYSVYFQQSQGVESGVGFLGSFLPGET